MHSIGIRDELLDVTQVLALVAAAAAAAGGRRCSKRFAR